MNFNESLYCLMFSSEYFCVCIRLKREDGRKEVAGFGVWRTGL
jgi:hypothetical protein